MRIIEPELDLGQLTEHFHLGEFECRDGLPIPIEYLGNVQLLASQLEIIRSELGDHPVRILSGYRSPSRNQRVGGAPRSKHLTGCAADIRVDGVSPVVVWKTIGSLILSGKLLDGGLGRYDSFVHYDVATGSDRPARWDGRRLVG